ncbi:MAG: S-layer protein [Candidatus Aenigmarchaeota archaeon]|nr:S-layer protein [Candidatus Aenigmarchaeota archaeon]
MKVKKILAGGLVAAAAGATIAFGALAQSTNLGAYVQVADSSLSSPMIVVGTQTANLATEYPNDILGAADIAAAVAGYASTPVTIGGGTIVSVADGVDLASTNTKILYGDTLTKSGLRSTLTNTNLPTLLAKGTFYDGSGTSYSYNQYINFGAGTVSFGTSGGDLTDPKLYLDTGVVTSAPLFNMSIVFNKVLNASNTDVRGQTIEFFGKTYTIGSTSAYESGNHKLVLFGGGGNTQTVSEGAEVDMSVAGVTHKVKVIGVSSTTISVISIDGTSKEVSEGNTYTIAGVDVYIDSVYYFGKETQLSQVKLSLGSSKLTLEHGAAVKTGQTEDTIDGTLVTLTGTDSQGISKIDISITAKDSSHDSITEGSSFVDPVFGGLKVAFGGLTKGATDTITVDNSGTTGANLKFTDYRGNEKSIIWAYTGTSSFNAQLNDTSTRAYHVIEGETVNKNDYVFIAPSQESEFGHIMQYTSASSLGSNGAYIELKDVFSGDTTRVYLTGSVGGGSYTSATFYVDGQSYSVQNASALTNQQMVFSWGTANVTAFPLIKAKNGEYVTLVKSVALGSTSGIWYQLPGSTDYQQILNTTTTKTAGRITYTFTAGISAATLTAIGGVNLSAAPAVLIYEEKGKNTAGTEVQDAVIVTVTNGGTGSNVEMKIVQPTLTSAGSSGFFAEQTDPSISWAYDSYGANVKYDSDSQGIVVITYPDDQATAMVAAGSDPKFSTAGTGGTYDAAVKIKNPVAKFDNEVSTASLTADLILIGGPCANSLVATLLSSESTTCTSDANGFITKYPNGLIKEVSNAFGSGKKALIVAGTNGAGTRALAAKVMQGTLAFS